MVLFYDDKKPAAPSGVRKYIRRSIKLLIIVCILLGLSLWVLSTLGGHSNSLRLGIQDYMTETTGYLAEIETLHEMSFFPVSRFSFENLVFYKPVRKEEQDIESADEARTQSEVFPAPKTMADFFRPGAPVARVGSGTASMSFWDMFFTRRRFSELEMRGVSIDAGIWMPKALALEFVKVVPDPESPAIVGTGSYGEHKLDFRLGVTKAADKSGAILYQIPDVMPVTATLGPLKLEGVVKSSGNPVHFDFTSFSAGDTSFSGSVVIDSGVTKEMVTADLKTGSSQMRADISWSQTGISGVLEAAALDMRDILAINKAYAEAKAVLGLDAASDRVSFGTQNIDLKLNIEKLMRADEDWGSLKANLEVKPYLLHLKNILGLIGGGAIKGDVLIDATGKESVLKAQAQLKGWDYARVQSQATAQADTHIRLIAEGKTFAELEKNLEGEIITIAGQGEFSGDSLLYWGDDMFKAMLPEASGQAPLKMNCMIADFDVKGWHAKAQTLMMDLEDFKVAGEGAANLDDLILDLGFVPEPKGEGRAVTVKGPLYEPEIKQGKSPQREGLFPGTIDRDSFSFNLTDLGLSGKHPCDIYVSKP